MLLYEKVLFILIIDNSLLINYESSEENDIFFLKKLIQINVCN